MGESKRILFSNRDLEDAEAMYEAIEKLVPRIFGKKLSLDDWAAEVRKIRELDGRTNDEIMALFKWANAQTTGNKTFQGWAYVILSPHKLRKSWVELASQKSASERGNSNQGKRISVSSARAALRD